MSSVSGQQFHNSRAFQQKSEACSTDQDQLTNKINNQAYAHLFIQDYFPHAGIKLPYLGRVLGVTVGLGIIYVGTKVGIPMNGLVCVSTGVALWPFFTAGSRAALEGSQSSLALPIAK